MRGGHFAVTVTLSSFWLILASINGVFSSQQNESQNFAAINELAKALQPENLLPALVESLGKDSKADIDCYKSLLPLIPSTSSKTPEWVYRMIDSSGKLGGAGGVLDGNLIAFGSYDACLNIEAQEETFNIAINNITNININITQPAFKGQYILTQILLVPTGKEDKYQHVALTHFEPSSMYSSSIQNLKHVDYGLGHSMQADLTLALLLGKPQFGMCLPSTCDSVWFEKSINVVIGSTLGSLAPQGQAFYGYVGPNHYISEPRPFTAGDIITIIILGILGLTALAGTTVDVMTSKWESKRTGLGVRLLLCFSWYTNGKKLLSTAKSEGNIDCIYGIRFLSIAWIVLGHSFYVVTLSPWDNPFAVFDVYSDWSMMMVFGGTLSVDTFFLLSGFLMGYLTLKHLDKAKTINPLMMYLHRYIRLTPAYGLIMLVLSTIILHFGSGPTWNFMERQADTCQENWWTNLLYINNFVNSDQSCMGESWYLACDFQLFILGPLIIFVIWKFQRLGIAFMALLMAVSCAIPGVLTGVKDWPPQNFSSILVPDWFSEFYIRFYTRSTPYIWGIIFGYILYKNPGYHRTKGKKLPWFVVALGWLISTTLCLLTVFGLVDYWPFRLSCLTSQCYDMGVAVSWATLGRLAWSVGVSWVIFACTSGYGGIISSFLSWKLFAPLSRLTYCIYLIHIHLLFFFHFQVKQVMHYDKYLIFYLFVGHMVISVIFAIIASLLFESPFIGLEKIIFGASPGKRKPRPTTIKSAENGATNQGFEKETEGVQSSD